MTTAQIIILGSICLLGILSIGFIFLSKKTSVKEGAGMGLFFIFGLVFMLLCLTLLELNKLRSENKCPEYEKVEDVYRLKKR